VTKTKTDKVKETYTMTVYPPPDFVYETTKTYTQTVPYACAQTPYAPDGSIPDGDTVYYAVYPYQPQTAADCCVLCYDSADFPNCVASAFIPDGGGSGECSLLLKQNATAGQPTSAQCPLGIDNYPFGPPTEGGFVLPGPCGY
jgi:hypothetical protein